jgi:tetratricopeptide (TPR) repeat protein
MKKIGLGTRPSEIKGRDKHIDLDETYVEEGFDKTRRMNMTVVKTGRRSSKVFWRVTLIVGVLLVGGFLLGRFMSFDFSFDIVFERAQVITGGKEISIRNGDSFNVAFSDGLQFKRLIFRGFYRLFPPDGIMLEVVGIPETANRFNEDIISFLSPEVRTVYDILVSIGKRNLGKITFTLMMDAQDWILRADSLENKTIKALCYNKAVTANPDSEEAHVALGRLYEDDKKVKKAIAAYESAIRINPANLSALESLISFYKRRGNRSKLIKTYEKLAEADGDQADTYYYQAGMIAEKKKDPDKAMSLYRKALAKNRGHINARERLIKIYEGNKEWNRVTANTRVLLEYDPKNPDLYLYLSDVYLKMNDMKNALAAAEKAVKYKTADSSIYLQLALLYEKAKKNDQAVEYYKKALNRDKRNAAACNNLGLLLEKQGNRREAITYYQKAVSLKPRNIGYYMNLGDAYEKNKEWEKAIAVYEQVIKQDKDNKDIWEALAILYYKTKKKWKTLEAYQALSRLEPKKILWHQKMAVLYEQLGKLDKAKEQYKSILRLDPTNQEAKQKYVEISKRQIKGKVK